MELGRLRAFRVLVTAGLALLVGATVVVAPAEATTQTKWYAVTASPSAVTVAGTSVTFAITDCAGAATAGCGSLVSNQTIGSANIVLPTGWTAGAPVGPAGWTVSTSSASPNVVQVRAVSAGLAPGQTLNVTATVTPAVTDAGHTLPVPVPVKQSNNFLGSGNDFMVVGSWPTLTVQQLQLVITQQPQTVQAQTTQSPPPQSMCPAVTVQLEDQSGAAVAVSGVNVTLSAAPGTADPLLTLGTKAPSSTNVTVATNAQGAAVFQNPGATCDGLKAWQSGGPYVLQATGPNAGFSAGQSASFGVFDYYQPCGGSCSTGTIAGAQGTDAAVSASGASGDLGVSVLAAAGFTGLDCGDAFIPERPEVEQVSLVSGTKTAAITWTKAVTLQDPRNGTPFWPVCMQAPQVFPTAPNGDPATPTAGGTFTGLVPLCSDSFVDPAVDPCMVLSRNKAQETATITLPLGWDGDPYFH